MQVTLNLILDGKDGQKKLDSPFELPFFPRPGDNLDVGSAFDFVVEKSQFCALSGRALAWCTIKVDSNKLFDSLSQKGWREI